MGKLVEAGYVVKKTWFRESNGGQTSNLYRLDFSEGQNMQKCNRTGRTDRRKCAKEKIETVCTNCKEVERKPDSDVHFISLKYVDGGGGQPDTTMNCQVNQ